MTPALLTSTSGAARGSLVRYRIKPALNSAGTPAHGFIAITTEETQAGALRTGATSNPSVRLAGTLPITGL